MGLHPVTVWILFGVAMAVLLGILLTLIRAIRGPTIYDRILAVNAAGTCTIGLVCLMGFLNGRPDFLDLAVAYALINFVGTIAVLRLIERKRLG